MSAATIVRPETSPFLVERQAALCKAMAHPTRIRLLDLLQHGEIATSELQRKLNISKANLSQHLHLLKSAGIIVGRRSGKQTFWSLAGPQFTDLCRISREIIRSQIVKASKLLA